MTLSEFLDRLDGVRASGNGFVAVCPAHDDREASLGVTEGEGSILLTCYAGCDTENVLDKMGLTFADLFARPQSTRRLVDTIYSYVDEQGNELFQAVRLAPKGFRQRHHDPTNEKADDEGWVWSLEEVRRVLYNLTLVRGAVENGDTIYITEGEKDADRLVECGKIATCNPMGAGKWKEEFNASLKGAQCVIIVADRDEPGRNHANTIKGHLEPIVERVLIVQARAGKDASDHLDAGFRVEDFKIIRNLRRGIVTASELAEHARERLEMTVEDLPGYILCDQIPLVQRPGRMYAIGAYTGDGKTCLALQALRTLATAGKRVGYFCLPPDQRVLTTDLKWVPIGEIEVGQDLIGFPEKLEPYKCPLVPSTVLRADRIVRPTWRITTDKGTVEASSEHLFVISNEFKKGSFRREWKATLDLHLGDRLCFFEEPWSDDDMAPEDRGYLAGALDGEGCISNKGSLNFYQNENPMLDRVKSILGKNGVSFSETIRPARNRSQPGHSIRVTNSSTMRLLGIARPPRLMQKSDDLWLNKRAWSKTRSAAVIQKIEFLGSQEVVALGTSTATFIAEGFLSHNSLEMPEIDLMNRLVAHSGIPLAYTEEPWKLKGSPDLLGAYNVAVNEISGWDSDIVFDSTSSSETIRERTIEREYEVVFVDHLHRFAWGIERRKLDSQVGMLTNIALELNVMVVVLCQLRKTTRGQGFDTYPRPTLQDFRETSMIGDDASMALAVWRQRDGTGLSYTGATEVIVLKNRHTTGPHDAAGKVFMPRFDPQRQMFVPAQTLQPAGGFE